MNQSLHDLLVPWGNFYLVTGTAAAALTGLQFVVQSLLASAPHRLDAGDDPEATIGAFGTPTVVHFSLALILSALMCVPWPGFGSLRLALGVLGGGAVVYAWVVLRRTRRQQGYVPVAEDWVWHVILPAVAYAGVLVGAADLGSGVEVALFTVAGATLLLLCIGIHNAWDTVIYLTARVLRAAPADRDPAD
jgi:hypothetical protein